MKIILPLVLCLSIFYSCVVERIDLDIEKIETNSELYTSLKAHAQFIKADAENVVCLEFVYPFNIYSYDKDDKIVSQDIILDNNHFISFLNQSKNESSVALSYPISTTTADGSEVNINNNEELKIAIEACIESQIIGNCEELLNECYWKVYSNTKEETYQDSLFDFYEDGTGVFYSNGNAFKASWIPLFIENELFINIHLEDDTETTKHWNFNWNAKIISDTEINIYNENNSYTINKVCDQSNECDYVEFIECEIEENEAIFVFDNYSECILSFKEESEIENLSITYFESVEDAEENLNELETTGYTNIENPQIIFTRIENTITEEIYLQRIVIAVGSCDN